MPAFVLVEWFEPLRPVRLGFAGGAMVSMVATRLVPDPRDGMGTTGVVAIVGAAAAAIVALQFLVPA